MLPFYQLNTFKDPNSVTFAYFLLDTVEGSECFGHWMWECAIYLPYIKELQKISPIPIKILLNGKKRYKSNILSDFGFFESDIVYSNAMSKYNDKSSQENHVIPEEPEYLAFFPTFFYLWTVSVNTTLFFDCIDRFRNFYIPNPVEKTIPFLYLRRSRKENYSPQKRSFLNIDAFVDMLEKNDVTILDVDTLTSFQPQVDLVLKSKVIIVEMGSAFTINACWLATNSHIIILNEFYGLEVMDVPWMEILRKQLKQRNNTYEIFRSPGIRQDFTVDVQSVESSIQLKRQACCICSHTNFEQINSFSRFPTMAISNDSVADSFFDYTLIMCKACKCLQLESLVDPSILYSTNYMNATFSPTWEDHHIHFNYFILKNTSESSFLEIGANTGTLYKLMSAIKPVSYTVLDMYRNSELPSSLNFIQGKCETFNYTGHSTVILSHVFEHLYSPYKFIKQIRKSNVSSVFISIPNFEILLNEQSLSMIHSQHTFYCGLDYIKYIFSKYSYRCETLYEYTGNFKSYMIKFVLDVNYSVLPLPTIETQQYINIYVNKIKAIQTLEIPHNSYICPSGIYGQYLYYFIKQKDRILGCIDNNPQRHGKKLFGTNMTVYSPNSVDYTNATVILCDCPYKNEIILDLKNKYSSISILEV